MFYKIKPSFDEKITGVDGDQASTAIYPINIWDPLHIGRWNFKAVPDYVIIPIPKVKTKAKLTDLMAVYFNGSSFRLTISNRLKEFLDKYQHGNIQFLPLTLNYKKKNVSGYWLTNIISFDNEDAVNYPISSVFLEGKGYHEYCKLNINSYEEHLFKRRENRDTYLEGYHSIYIHELVFKENTAKNLVVINYIRNGGIGYYISEKLKNEIEEAGCTGIEFEPVEQG
jgi:hypothetical protein